VSELEELDSFLQDMYPPDAETSRYFAENDPLTDKEIFNEGWRLGIAYREKEHKAALDRIARAYEAIKSHHTDVEDMH